MIQLLCMYFVLMQNILDNSPTITKQPESRTIALRTMNFNLSLSCQANGNVQYTWEKFNGSLPDNINSSDTPTLNFTFLSPSDVGKYRCRVSDDNGYYGYSNYAVLKINGQVCMYNSLHTYICIFTIYSYTQKIMLVSYHCYNFV